MTKTAQTQTSPIIEAKQYRDLLEDGFTIEQIAKRTGRKVAKINERLRLLNLDAAILKRCSKEAGFDYVAQEIARIPDFAAQKRALKVWDAREDKSNWGFVVLKAAVAGELNRGRTITITTGDRQWAAKFAPAAAAVEPGVAKRALAAAEVGHMVSMYLEGHEGIGCGDRQLVVMEIGARHVRLFSAACLKAVEVTREDFDKYAKPYRVSAAISAIIDRNCSTFDRADLDYDPRITRKMVGLTAQMALAA